MKRPFKTFLFLSLILVTAMGFAQNHAISGFAEDIDGRPVAFANVILMKVADSSVVKGVSTNDKGFFLLDKLESGSYLLKISYLGFNDDYKSLLVDQVMDLGIIVLYESSEELDEVSIIVKKPTLRKEADRLVFNVENTALIEGNMFDVLKSTPGVLVMDNNIQVKNSTPTVYINDKKVHLSSEELVQLLESSSANSIKSVEVITNPSAKYDAESGAVINIVMSKNLVTGYRGNVFANFTQGVFPRYDAGMSHFFKNDKVDFFANYTYSHDKINRGQEDVINYLDGAGNINEIFKSETNRNTWSRTHNFNFNLDYNINEKNTLSLSSNVLVLPYFEYKINNNTNVFEANQNLDYYFDANNLSNDDKYNLGFDLNYVHQFEKSGEKLSANAHFTTYNYNRNQNVKSNYFDSDNSFLATNAFRTDNHQDTEIYTAKLDYNLPIDEATNLEIGAKGSNINSASNITQFDIVNGTETIDPNNTNAFDYDETIYAGYVNFSKDWEKLNLTTGLRAEKTMVEGLSVYDNVTNTQDYLEWFPTASLNYTFSDNFSLYTNYKRSIGRPDYQSLNPFQFYLNDVTIVVGNPNLKPVIVDNVVLGTSLGQGVYTIEAYYKTYSNNIFELPLQDNVNNILTYTPLNLDKTVEYGIDFITYFNVVDTWSVYFATSFFNAEDQGQIEGSDFKKDLWSNYSVVSNDISFLKDRSLNVNFTLVYLSKSISGFREVNEMLMSNLSLSKTILKDKATISLAVSDLFNTQDFNIRSRYLNQNNSTYFDQDTWTIKLGFRYKFGNTNLETNQRQVTEEETERLEKKQN
ncbi:outer membrane beta-barrel family protein [Gelidibacter sp.]|uniref:outer membrane beta-barrel family protein n=1 Tax=Gelidibacter sp. TaxID=2018083 RepID=UPI002C322CD2|nr:outer membrane beta-barrel family protein [Gelidibacter sp.]HUH29016.1 outer membrane beta-barrel family protein [Gelidibacter sp.]